ncbi:MAG: hypothetical protein WEB37_02360 [Bacteroidota bacterium]
MRIIVSSLLTAGMLGCSLFDTRDPENPVQSSATYNPPTTVDIVFGNLVSSFQDRNSVNYARSFADSSFSGRSFVFEPTSQASSQYAGVFASWTKMAEQQYFDNFNAQLQPSSVPVLIIARTSESPGADSAFVEGTYQLSIPHTITGVQQSATGRFQFYLLRDSRQYWVIWRWVDLANNPGDFTWSDFKGTFGQ